MKQRPTVPARPQQRTMTIRVQSRNTIVFDRVTNKEARRIVLASDGLQVAGVAVRGVPDGSVAATDVIGMGACRCCPGGLSSDLAAVSRGVAGVSVIGDVLVSGVEEGMFELLLVEGGDVLLDDVELEEVGWGEGCRGFGA